MLLPRSLPWSLPYSLSWSLAQPFQDRRHVHLIGFVVAGQRIHDDVDAEAKGHLALPLAAGRHREQGLAEFVGRPGSGIIVAADQDSGNAVIDAAARHFHPDRPPNPTTGEVAQQIKG